MQQFSVEEMRERSQDVLQSATREPVLLVNQSQPSYIVLSIQSYQQLIARLVELEDQVLGKLATAALQTSSMTGTEVFMAELRRFASLDEPK
jgi:PHD/YefM family antitoxin component YafN of YafNO toxin-antitoxin module